MMQYSLNTPCQLQSDPRGTLVHRTTAGYYLLKLGTLCRTGGQSNLSTRLLHPRYPIATITGTISCRSRQRASEFLTPPTSAMAAKQSLRHLIYGPTELCRHLGALLSAATPAAPAGAAAWVLAQAPPAAFAASHALPQISRRVGVHHYFSSQAGDDNAASGSSSSTEAVVDQLDRLMDVMMSNPAMQQMMLSRMPPHMRRPEVLKAMMANPEVRQRIAALAAQSGLGSMLSGLDPAKLQSQLSDSNQAGLDPTALFERFQQSPSLGPRMSDPRVLAALMDMASHGPEALKKYESDKDIVEAAMEAGDIIQQMQQEQDNKAGSSGTSSAGGSTAGLQPTPSLAGIEQLGLKPHELMQRLMAKPELLAKVQDPKVNCASCCNTLTA
eukprot:GHUV01026707.1.p1 GENE.GHUV01026707.1~~GHUV01026707.1.p1  ORF type:complete len:385 (+),score=94.03 GHUV01026707.1:234-1388(+)